MTPAATFPVTARALRVVQPLGIYYVAVLPATVLLEVAYSDRLSAHLSRSSGTYELDGTQRLIVPKRLDAIADYINREDAAFPNSIILAANLRKDDGSIETDEDPDNDSTEASVRWSIKDLKDGCHQLTIPTNRKLAAVIDGQHRLFAFAQARERRYEMDLICSIFLDLPKPYQAQLFATINSTQKPVDKSLTYELFGYNVEKEAEEFWSPDKLAVYLTRRLGIDDASPLKGRIAIAPIQDEQLQLLTGHEGWMVSTAVVVEGILKLITTNPNKDAAYLLSGEHKKRESLTNLRIDRSPLRAAYLSMQDAVLYALVINYLRACNSVFWERQPKTVITKTVGIQALFDVLRRHIAKTVYETKKISVEAFAQALRPAAQINFAEEQFQNFSGSGRTHIRRVIEATLGIEN